MTSLFALPTEKPLVILDTNAVVHLTRAMLNPPLRPDLLERLNEGALTPQEAFQAAQIPLPPELFIYSQYQADALTLAFNRKLRQEWWEVVVDLRDMTNHLDGTSRRARMEFVSQLGDSGLLLDEASSLLKCRDKKDQMVLEAAHSAYQDGYQKVFIVTHDSDLLVLQDKSTQFGILQPRPFAQRWSGFGHVA